MKNNSNNEISNSKVMENTSIIGESTEVQSIRKMLKRAYEQNAFVIIKIQGTYKALSGYIKELSNFTLILESEDHSAESMLKIQDIKVVQIIKR